MGTGFGVTRRGLLLGGIGFAGTYALGCGKKSPALEEAVRNEKLRQEYLTANAKGLEVIYDPDGALYKENLRKCGFVRAKVELYPVERAVLIDEPFSEARYQKLAHDQTSMVVMFDLRKFGTGSLPKVYVHDLAFKHCVLPNDAENSETFFLSALEHERQHAEDSKDGIIVTRHLKIDRDTALYLSLDALDSVITPIMELRAYEHQLRFQYKACRKTFEQTESAYKTQLEKLIAFVNNNRRHKFGKVRVNDIVSIILEQELADPVLLKIIENRRR